MSSQQLQRNTGGNGYVEFEFLVITTGQCAEKCEYTAEIPETLLATGTIDFIVNCDGSHAVLVGLTLAAIMADPTLLQNILNADGFPCDSVEYIDSPPGSNDILILHGECKCLDEIFGDDTIIGNWSTNFIQSGCVPNPAGGMNTVVLNNGFPFNWEIIKSSTGEITVQPDSNATAEQINSVDWDNTFAALETRCGNTAESSVMTVFMFDGVAAGAKFVIRGLDAGVLSDACFSKSYFRLNVYTSISI